VGRFGTPSPWAVIPNPNSSARLRLLCFPYAGGGASRFYSWAQRLGPEIELCAVQLPGREGRLTENAFSNLPSLIDTMAPELEPCFDRAFAFFGHSNGGLIAFELARWLRREAAPLPQQLVVSASSAPQLPPGDAPIHSLPDREFVGELRRLKGTPENILENQELMQLVLPSLRADFSLRETYLYRQEPPLPIPISVFRGQRDPEVSAEGAEAWREQTTGVFRVRVFSGDHFFIHSERDLVLQELAARLQPGAGTTGCD
jgi:medium-chain acyl-[acyl-carrier-protein] hydrolase